MVAPRDPNVFTPGGTHKAAASGPLSSLPWRTFLQGVAIDVLVALALVVLEATATGSPDWRLLLASFGRTVAQTVASAVMRHFRPPVSPPG